MVPYNNPFIPADLATLLASRTGDDPRLVGAGATEPWLYGFRPLGFGARVSQFQNTVVQYMGGLNFPVGEKFEVEAYISRHSEAEFTHGICPACTDGAERT